MSNRSSVHSFEMIQDDVVSLAPSAADEFLEKAVNELAKEIRKAPEAVKLLEDSDSEDDSDADSVTSESSEDSRAIYAHSEDSEEDEHVAEALDELKLAIEGIQAVPVPETKEFSIPAGMVLVGQECYEGLQNTCELLENEVGEQKKIVSATMDKMKEKEMEVKKLENAQKGREKKIAAQTKAMEIMNHELVTSKMAGKYRLVNIEDINADLVLEGESTLRRFVTFISPLHIKFENGQLKTYNQFFYKKFNEKSTTYTTPLNDPNARNVEVKFTRNGIRTLQYKRNSPAVKWGDYKKILVDEKRDEVMIGLTKPSFPGDRRFNSTKYEVYVRAQKRTEIVRQVLRSAYVMLHQAIVPQ